MRILLICAVLTAAALGASQSDRVARPDRVERMGQFSSDRSVVAAAFSRADQRAARSGVDPYSPLDRVAAFARLYGAVRFFYRINWPPLTSIVSPTM